MAVEEHKNAFTMIWTVENYSWSLYYVKYTSPVFTNKVDRSKWQLCVKRSESDFVDLRICRNFQRVCVDAELSLLDSDGSVLVSKTFENQNSESLHDLCILFWDGHISSNLTARCRLWKTQTDFKESTTVSALTRLKEEYVYFIWAIKDYSSLHGTEPRHMKMEVQRRPIILSYRASFFDDGTVAVTLHYIFKCNISIISTFQISVLNGASQAIVSEVDSRPIGKSYHQYKRFTQTLKFPCLEQKLIGNKSYLPEDVLSLRCEVIMKGVPIHILHDDQLSVRDWAISSFLPEETDMQNQDSISNSQKNAGSSLFEDLKLGFENILFSDYTLYAENKAFPVHRAVLCSRSSVFHSMFIGDMKEASETSMNLPNLDAGTLHRFLLFLYTDHLEDGLNWEEVCRLYAVADQYEVLPLRESCSSVLKSRFTVGNACEILVLAVFHGDEVLKAVVKHYIMAHKERIVWSAEWENFCRVNSNIANQCLEDLPVNIGGKRMRFD